MENPEDQQTKAKYFITFLFQAKKHERISVRLRPWTLDAKRICERAIYLKAKMWETERQFAWQYDKIYFLKAVVRFIHWMKHFPDSSLQHLVTVPGDFGVANPSFWRCTYFDRSRPLLKRHLKSRTGWPFLPPTAPFHVITNSSTFKLTSRHDSEWLTGWTFVNKEKLLKTIYVGRVQHMKILVLTKILIFRY